MAGTYTVLTGDIIDVNSGVKVIVADTGTLEITGTTSAIFGKYENNGTTEVSGLVDIKDFGEYSNAGTTTVENGGSIVTSANGELVNESGAGLTFKEGSSLSLGAAGDGNVTNLGTMTFDSGSVYTSVSGSGVFSNQREMIVNTGVVNFADLLNDTVGGGASTLEIQGSASQIGNAISYTTVGTAAGSKVIINTAANDTYSSVDVGVSDLDIRNTSKYTGPVNGANISIGNGSLATVATFEGTVTATGTFTVTAGASAIFGTGGSLVAAGAITNNNIMTFQNGSTLNSAGAVANNGTLTFDSGSIYTASGTITNNDGGVINYHTGMNGFNTAFNNTELKASGSGAGQYSVLNINGSTAVTGPISLISGNQHSQVIVTDGTVFNGAVDVKGTDTAGSTLIVRGGAATTFKDDVTAAEIVADSGFTTTFEKQVIGDLTVKGASNAKAELASTATFAGKNITIENGGTLTNSTTTGGSGSLTISAGNTFANAGNFINNGVFINSSSTPGDITNTGTMTFQAGTIYTNAAGSQIFNDNIIEASAGMSDLSLRTLMLDINLHAATSQFNLIGSGSLGAGTYTLGATTAGSTANMIAGTGNTITLNNGVIYDVKSAILNIGTGTVALAATTANVVLTTTGAFTAGTDAALTVSSGTSYRGEINAASATFSKNSTTTVAADGRLDINAVTTDFADSSKVTVNTGGVLNINSTGGTTFSDTSSVNVEEGGTTNISHGLAMTGTSSVNIAKNGNVNVNTAGAGATNFGSGTSITMGESAKFTANDAITFADNTKITVTATASDISQISTTNGNITVSANGTTEVYFLYTDKDDIVDKVFLWANSIGGQVENYDKLYNALYTFDLDPTVPQGEGVIVSGFRSTVDSIANAVGGYDRLSINKINGGNYTDQVLGTTWGSTNNDLLDYLQIAGGSTLGPDGSYMAYGQLFGEYGAYSSTTMLHATEQFNSSMRQRMNTYRGGSACMVCVEVVDPDCDSCGGGMVVTSANGAVAAGRTNVWGGAFGDWSRQKDLKGVHGYDYSAGGVIMGFDYANDCFTVGLAGAYTNGSLKVNRLRTEYDTDTLNLGVYGSYRHESGMFLQGYAGYGYGWNEYDVSMLIGGKKNGDYKNQSYNAGMELGYRAELDGGWRIIPSVGVEYNHVAQDAWTETVHRSGTSPILANHFDRNRYNSVEIPVRLSIGKVIEMGDARIVPEVRGGYIYQANDRRYNIGSGYAGSGSSTTMYGTDCGPSRGMVGGGVKAMFSDCFDMAVDYSFHFKGGYRDHQLTGTLNWAF